MGRNIRRTQRRLFLKPTFPELLDELALLTGFEFTYTDGMGEERVVAPEIRREFFERMGLRVSTEEETLAAIEAMHERVWNDGIAPARVLTANEAELPWSVYLPEGFLTPSYRLEWVLHQEDGQTRTRDIPLSTVRSRERALVKGHRLARVEIPPPPLPPIGYHGLHLMVFKAGRTVRELRCRYILTPTTCYLPAPIRDSVRGLWGVSTDVYALRSAEDWGAGDLGTLGELAEEAGRNGAAILALSPLHLIWNRSPASTSPYYPVSRLYRNPLYVNIPGVPEFSFSDKAHRIMDSAVFTGLRSNARTAELLDYDTVASLKQRVMRCLFETFMTRSFDSGDERDRAFKSFRNAEGPPLRETSVFLALHDHFRKILPSVWDWREWPEAFRRKDSPEVKAFMRNNRWDVRFHEYVQWCLDDQLREASASAVDAGMAVGLLTDLAVGSDPSGAEAWAESELFVDGVEMGAPPDAFNMLGQSWGIPPMNPGTLRAGGYQFFVRLVRAAMRHAGAVRIDHILGFFRAFWVLRGRTPVEGAYVEYPAEDLLKIVCLESHRNRTLVVGEDLGVVTAAVRSAMDRFGIFSSRLVYFERRPDGEFPAPGEYPRLAWATVNTHDLPTLAGWWSEADIDLKKRLDLFPRDDPKGREAQARWDRGVDRWRLLSRLHEEGIVHGEFPREPDHIPDLTPELRDAVWTFLCRTPSLLVTVGLHDLLLVTEQQNMPGTFDEHPNWKHRLPEEIMSESVLGQLKRAASVFGARTDAGRSKVVGGFRQTMSEQTEGEE